MSYGWADFDHAIVAAIERGDRTHVVKEPDGGMRCPLVGHDDWLAWNGGSHRQGTVVHGSPSVSFRVSPTYILSDRLANFIVGRDLVSAAIKGEWNKAETHRLGHENSEDALSFNVFRTLQETRSLGLVAELITGRPSAEPDLFLWGRHIARHGSEVWEGLEQARSSVEPAHRQQTEPDVCLHVPGWGWIFIEAKFGFGIKTSPSADSFARWLDLYPGHAPSLFDLKGMGGVPSGEFPEQLLRNMVFADLIRTEGEQAHVVALGRENDRTPIEEWVVPCLAVDCPITISRLSWEQIYHALPTNAPDLAALRGYLEDKSYSLRPAFNLGSPLKPAVRT